jgi:tetratricopeptide (TPR) repeat protein/Zn-dependent protease with chaperone function
MALRLKLLAFVMSVPVAMIAMGAGFLLQVDDSWSHAMTRAAWVEGRVAGAEAGTTLREICGDGRSEAEACTQRRYALWMVITGIGAMVVGAGLLGRRLSGGNGDSEDRDRLVRLFRPALWITLGSASVMSLFGFVLTARLMMLTMRAGTVDPTFRRSVGMILVAVLFGLFGLIDVITRALRRGRADVVGSVASREGSPALRRVVGDVARKVGAPVPSQVVLGLSPTFFVTEATVRCPGAKLTGRTMYLSLPLCRVLSVEELSCIIGHELAHFASADTRYSECFGPTYRRALRLPKVPVGGQNLLAKLLLHSMFSPWRYLFESFAEAEAGVSRDLELRADRESIKAADALTAATALVKAQVFSTQWDAVMEETFKDNPRLEGHINLGDLFERHVRTMRRGPELLNGALDDYIVHPINSHPPLRARLANLGVTLDQVREAALSLPARPASALCGDVATIEMSLSPILLARYGAYAQMMERFATAALVVIVSIALATVSGCRPLTVMADTSTSEAAIPHFAMPAALPDRLELLTLLRNGQFEDLDRRLEKYAHGSGSSASDEGEPELVSEAAFETFSVADPSLGTRLDEWVTRMPSSPRALAARATYLVASGYQARTAAWGAEVTPAQWQAMRTFHSRARADAEQAITRDPALIDAHVAAISVARAQGDDETCEALTRRALQTAPASLRVRAACLICLMPRWGSHGSYLKMQAFAVAAQQRADRNPRLQELLGFVDWEQGRRQLSSDDANGAIERFTRALSHGEYWQFYEARARAHRHAGNNDLALRDYEQAIRLRPYDVDLLVARADILARLQHPIDGLPSLTRAAQWDPSNADVRKAFADLTQTALGLGARHLKAQRLTEAQPLLEAALQANPNDVEALYWTGRMQIAQNDNDAALTTFRRAVAIDPGHYESCRNVDYLLARQGQWNDVVLVWSNYLTHHPEDGRAYLERAGAYHHYDQSNAAADLHRACELGTQQACQILGR